MVFVELVSYCAWYCNLKMNRCVFVCYIVTVPTFFFESLFIEMQMLTHNHCDRPSQLSLRKTQGSFLKHLWKGLKLHHDCKMAPREHGHQHCCTRSIANSQSLRRIANAVSTTEIMFADFYKKGKLSQRTGQILLDMMRHRFFDPKDIAAKRLCTCSGDSSGRLQKPQCTLTTYGRKGMETSGWSLLCSITWNCFGK